MNRPRTPARLPTPLRAAVLGLAVVAVVGLALVAGRIGRWTSRPTTGSAMPTLAPPTRTTATAPATMATAAEPPSEDTIDWLFRAFVVAAVVLLVVVVLLWLVRTVREWARDRPSIDTVADLAPEVVPSPAPPTIPEAAVGRQFDPRAAADAIISCWLWVEKAAAAQGVPREYQDTPTEFLQRYLSQPAARHGADEGDRHQAAATLLPLYQRARFDQAALTETAALQARDAALALGAGRRGAADLRHDPDRPTADRPPAGTPSAGSGASGEHR